MTIEISEAVRDYIEKLSRQGKLRTVGDLLRAIDGEIKERQRVTKLIGA